MRVKNAYFPQKNLKKTLGQIFQSANMMKSARPLAPPSSACQSVPGLTRLCRRLSVGPSPAFAGGQTWREKHARAASVSLTQTRPPQLETRQQRTKMYSLTETILTRSLPGPFQSPFPYDVEKNLIQ